MSVATRAPERPTSRRSRFVRWTMAPCVHSSPAGCDPPAGSGGRSAIGTGASARVRAAEPVERRIVFALSIGSAAKPDRDDLEVIGRPPDGVTASASLFGGRGAIRRFVTAGSSATGERLPPGRGAQRAHDHPTDCVQPMPDLMPAERGFRCHVGFWPSRGQRQLGGSGARGPTGTQDHPLGMNTVVPLTGRMPRGPGSRG